MKKKIIQLTCFVFKSKTISKSSALQLCDIIEDISINDILLVTWGNHGTKQYPARCI